MLPSGTKLWFFFLCIKSCKFIGDHWAVWEGGSGFLATFYSISTPPPWHLLFSRGIGDLLSRLLLWLLPSSSPAENLGCACYVPLPTFSRVPPLPHLQSMLWFNSAINQFLEYPVPQHQMKMPIQCKFWLSINSLFWFVLFLVCFFFLIHFL